jgi:glycosyltransferase involved in cell wall biosynthesis
MMLSKHHYALELAKRGNNVYFLNPPKDVFSFKSHFERNRFPAIPGLMVIDHQLYFPDKIKFHALWLYRRLMRRHIDSLVQFIDRKLDLIISFDLHGKYPLDSFTGDCKKIYFPADNPIFPNSRYAVKGAGYIISVTKEILKAFDDTGLPQLLLNHGLSSEFVVGNVNTAYLPNKPLRVGLSGNFLRQDLDHVTLMKIVEENQDVFFELWGSYGKSNIGGSDSDETRLFIEKLKSLPNVVLHGIVDKKSLADGFAGVDAFLICYDVNKDQSKGSNYHKVIEYLSTGKAIISNNVSAYRDEEDMVYMVSSREDNMDLPRLFRAVIGKLHYYNEPGRMLKRINFARANSYASQLDKIEKFLSGNEAN